MQTEPHVISRLCRSQGISINITCFPSSSQKRVLCFSPHRLLVPPSNAICKLQLQRNEPLIPQNDLHPRTTPTNLLLLQHSYPPLGRAISAVAGSKQNFVLPTLHTQAFQHSSVQKLSLDASETCKPSPLDLTTFRTLPSLFPL